MSYPKLMRWRPSKDGLTYQLKSNDLTATVDIVDWPQVKLYTWNISCVRGRNYVMRFNEPKYLHRLIAGLHQGDKQAVDFVDGNTLNCRRENLRIVSLGQTRSRSSSPQGTNAFRNVIASGNSYVGKFRHQYQIYQTEPCSTAAEAYALVQAMKVKLGLSEVEENHDEDQTHQAPGEPTGAVDSPSSAPGTGDPVLGPGSPRESPR